jgi:hypothetical protein
MHHDLYQYIEKGAYRFEGLDVVPSSPSTGDLSKALDFRK